MSFIQVLFKLMMEKPRLSATLKGLVEQVRPVYT